MKSRCFPARCWRRGQTDAACTTLEGLQEEADEFGAFIADQGAEQCGFCNPGFIMNALALFRENPDPSEDEIKEYLAGNLCRCSGYEGQLRGILNVFSVEKGEGGCPMKAVNQSMRKKDAMQLVTGQPVYVDDVIPQDCLIVKLLRSPHANAIVQDDRHEPCPEGAGHRGNLHMEGCGPAGPRATPRRGRPTRSRAPMTGLLIDRHVRFAGDVVAIVAGKDEKCVDKATEADQGPV